MRDNVDAAVAGVTPDPRSIAGKALPVAEETQLLVVGAGAAGLAAALEAAALGLRVVLAEENPVPAATIGLDVPLHFGGRAGGAVRNRNAMMEAVLASDPAIAQAFEAGVDVRLATAVWGLWSNNAAVRWLPGLVAGLMTDGTTSLLRADRVVVAAGHRDVGLAFPGWEARGVMGACAAERLLRRYGALETRRVAVLGSTAETLQTCRALLDGGIEIAALVEQAGEPADPDAAEIGAPLLLRHAPRHVLSSGGEVEGLVVGQITPEGRAVPGTDRTLRCDTVLLGVGAVPQVELLDALGALLRFDPARGGHVPMLDPDGGTSVAGVYAAGDCAGIWRDKTRDPAVAEREGRRAARAAARSLGVDAAMAAGDPPPTPRGDMAAYRLGWVRACVVEACGDETHVCQCESVTAREIMEVRPPRYLGCPGSGRNTARNLRSLLGDGPPDPDQVKRLTRAGMGLCQGRRCREQVAGLLALSTGAALGEVALATHRAPVRPIPLAAAAETNEPPEVAEQWDTWFGIASQYRPPWEVGPLYTAAGRDLAGPGEVSSE